MKKIFNLVKENWILVLILLAGLFLRAFKPFEFFMYSHDQDLAGWFVKDVLVNHHIRLVGQETSSQGVYIGPLYYYLQIPFYLLSGMDPAGPLLLSIILGICAVFSFYFVFSKIFDKRIGLISALIYSLSLLIIFTDREVAPTMPVMLWTVWFFYSIWLLVKGQQKSYLLIGALFGVVWNFNLALAILSPIVVLAQIFSKKKINFKYLGIGILLFGLLMAPYFVFEVRHGFGQTRAVVDSLTTSKGYIPGTSKGFLPKLDRVLQLVHKNTTSLYWDSVFDIPSYLTFYLLILFFVFLAYKNRIPKNLAAMMFLWQTIYILFFTLNSINVSEYYLNGMNVIWIAVLAVMISHLLSSKSTKYLGFLVIGLFVALNLYSFSKKEINRSGYVERKAIVSYIHKDSLEHGYPCVSISYITSPGNNLGYRYLFWKEGLHVNNPSSGSPVYTIVYPLSMVYGVDKTFGVLGLVLPDYQRYTKEEVDVSCSGLDSNLTDPLFGFSN